MIGKWKKQLVIFQKEIYIFLFCVSAKPMKILVVMENIDTC